MFLYPLKYYNDYDNDAHGNNTRKKVKIKTWYVLKQSTYRLLVYTTRHDDSKK